MTPLDLPDGSGEWLSRILGPARRNRDRRTPTCTLSRKRMMSPVNEATLEQRVAALEELIASPPGEIMIKFPDWNDEQVAQFKAEFERGRAIGFSRPLLTPETARALLRECVTIVRPGETLVIRVPDTWTPQQADVYQEYADAATASGRILFPVLVVLGAELGVARVEPGNPVTVER